VTSCCSSLPAVQTWRWFAAELAVKSGTHGGPNHLRSLPIEVSLRLKGVPSQSRRSVVSTKHEPQAALNQGNSHTMLTSGPFRGDTEHAMCVCTTFLEDLSAGLSAHYLTLLPEDARLYQQCRTAHRSQRPDKSARPWLVPWLWRGNFLFAFAQRRTAQCPPDGHFPAKAAQRA